jgi:hypothetical protein
LRAVAVMGVSGVKHYISSRGGGGREERRNEETTKIALEVQHDHVSFGVSTHLEQIPFGVATKLSCPLFFVTKFLVP